MNRKWQKQGVCVQSWGRTRRNILHAVGLDTVKWTDMQHFTKLQVCQFTFIVVINTLLLNGKLYILVSLSLHGFYTCLSWHLLEQLTSMLCFQTRQSQTQHFPFSGGTGSVWANRQLVPATYLEHWHEMLAIFARQQISTYIILISKRCPCGPSASFLIYHVDLPSSQYVQKKRFWKMFIFQLFPLLLMNCVLWEQKHIALYIFKASAIVPLSLCRAIMCFQNSSFGNSCSTFKLEPTFFYFCFEVFIRWYWASVPDYNLDYVRRIKKTMKVLTLFNELGT